MSEWDFTWGLTGKELEEAQSSGLAPDECGYAFDENMKKAVYIVFVAKNAENICS